MVNSNRNWKIDCLKGLLAYMVVLGHCLYDGSEVNNHQLLIRFIYSFHMPLFMLLCGWFTVGSLKNRGWKNFICARAIQLLRPIVFWAALQTLVEVVETFIIGKKAESFAIIVLNFWYRFFHNYWFLWAVLVVSFIVLVVEELVPVKLRAIFYFALIGFSVITPDNFPNSAVIKSVFPFFVIGYKMRESKKIENYMNLWSSKCFLLLSNFAFLIGVWLYRLDFIIDVSGFSLFGKWSWNQAVIILSRMLIGIIGCIAITIDVVAISRLKLQSELWIKCGMLLKKVLIWCGMNSMPIYIIHYYILNKVMGRVLGDVTEQSFFLICVTSLFVLGGSYVLIRGIRFLRLGKLVLGDFK